MQILRRLCLGALLLELAACANEVDQTSVHKPTRDDSANNDQLGDGRLDSNQPNNLSPIGGHCTVQPGGGRFALCGGLSSMPSASLGGTAITGSTLRFAPVGTEIHNLEGEIRAN